MKIGLGMFNSLAGSAAHSAVLPTISFIGQSTPSANTDIDASGIAFANNDLAIFLLPRLLSSAPTKPDGWTEIFPADARSSTNSAIVGWWQFVSGGALTDPAAGSAGRHRLLVYRGAQIKSGSVATLGHATASTTVSIPACTVGAGEWGVAYAYCRDSVADMDPILPTEATDQGGGTGVRRFNAEGNANLNVICGGTGGNVGNTGWAQKDTTITSMRSFGLSFVLEPFGT